MPYYAKKIISRYKMGCMATASQERQRKAQGTIVQPPARRQQIAKKIQSFKPPEPLPPTVAPLTKKEVIPHKKQIQLKKMQLILDKSCPMYSSYETSNGVYFKKVNFNWFSLPIISPVNLNESAFFTVKNVSIKFNRFVAGIIREIDLRNLVSTPWKTEGVIYYQSSSKQQGSWIRHGEKTYHAAREIASGQTLSIVVRQKNIQFWINKYFQGSIPIPQQFFTQICLPYVSVFCSQDTFQVGGENPLQPYYPP